MDYTFLTWYDNRVIGFERKSTQSGNNDQHTLIKIIFRVTE